MVERLGMLFHSVLVQDELLLVSDLGLDDCVFPLLHGDIEHWTVRHVEVDSYE